MAPTVGTDVSSLPPEGVRFALGRPGGETFTPTVGTDVSSLPPKGARFALGRPGGETHQKGFTLLELLVVVAIIGLGTAGVALSMRDGAQSQLEREAQRLSAMLESARAQSRSAGVPVRWVGTAQGFRFEGMPMQAFPGHWLNSDTSLQANTSIMLGPEPLIGRQAIVLISQAQPGRSLTVATDGLQPFRVQAGDQP